MKDYPDLLTRTHGMLYSFLRVHVRRTDKVGLEAAFHHLDEYMEHVDEFFNLLDKFKRVERRRVYLASDDPSVLQDAKLR